MVNVVSGGIGKVGGSERLAGKAATAVCQLGGRVRRGQHRALLLQQRHQIGTRGALVGALAQLMLDRPRSPADGQRMRWIVRARHVAGVPPRVGLAAHLSSCSGVVAMPPGVRSDPSASRSVRQRRGAGGERRGWRAPFTAAAGALGRGQTARQRRGGGVGGQMRRVGRKCGLEAQTRRAGESLTRQDMRQHHRSASSIVAPSRLHPLAS